MRWGGSWKHRGLCCAELLGSRCERHLLEGIGTNARELAECCPVSSAPAAALPCVRGSGSLEWEPYEPERAAGLF